ncbi:MAG TPA: neutral/alkaline non-lysosomal ceramidase N-terminal domain-containing protein [Methylomirabilota bacterium]|nr:neutral/alkaline non-lysosomal ceramidase N-terminal domain-containing protein [Methylomirabilota bacterium]
MTGRARRALAAATLALVTTAAAPAPAAAQGACADCVVAGAAGVPITVPAGTPLAGYGGFQRRLFLPDVFDRYPHAFWFTPGRGERDALATRALVLERDGTRVIWVAVDLVAVDRAFTDTVATRLARAGARPGVLIVSASHTHSGPGAFVDSALLGFVAVDREDAAVREALVASVVEAVRKADGARGPARVSVGTAAAPSVVRSRLGGPLDLEMVVLAVRRASGAPVALVWNFAIHGTMLSARNLKLSGDVMGVASATLERALGAPALFVNGAVGDVSPARHGGEALAAVAAALAETARAAWSSAVPVGPGPLVARVARMDLPAPQLSLRNCLGGWMPAAVTLPLDGAFPGETTLTGVALGDTAWVALPGEPATALGLRIKSEARRSFRHAFVAGVSNDYVGYLVAAPDYARPAYVTCNSVYGAETGDRIAARASALLRELGTGRGR